MVDAATGVNVETNDNRRHACANLGHARETGSAPWVYRKSREPCRKPLPGMVGRVTSESKNRTLFVVCRVQPNTWLVGYTRIRDCWCVDVSIRDS